MVVIVGFEFLGIIVQRLQCQYGLFCCRALFIICSVKIRTNNGKQDAWGDKQQEEGSQISFGKMFFHGCPPVRIGSR